MDLALEHVNESSQSIRAGGVAQAGTQARVCLKRGETEIEGFFANERKEKGL